MSNTYNSHEPLKLVTLATGRNLAVRALADKHGNVSAHLRRLISETTPPARERGFARELSMGVLRRRGTIEAVLKAYLKNPKKRLPSPIKEIMHVGLYQVLYLDRVPASAAVDEAVNQTVNSHHKRQSGLVNGLLRTVLREMSKPIDATMETKLTESHIPVGGGRVRLMQRKILPDPETDLAANLAAAYSLPLELADRWIEQYEPTEARRLAARACLSPPLIARVNMEQTDVESVIASLAAEDTVASPHENGCSIVMNSAGNLTQLQAFVDGLIQPQDPTASAVVNAIDIEPGMAVLDLCAAPGTKTIHLAERMKNQGRIVAVDISTGKLSKITDSCKRMGISIVKTVRASQMADSLEPKSFDVVLVDAPCSNTGVLARRPEAKWRFSNENLLELTDIQQTLASKGAEFLKPTGQLIYSTCSIETEENSDIADWLIEQNDIKGLELIEKLQTLPAGGDCPEKWHDGGFFAKFRMRG